MTTQILLACFVEVEWPGSAKDECLILEGMERSKRVSE